MIAVDRKAYILDTITDFHYTLFCSVYGQSSKDSTSMAKMCSICHRGPMTANSRSHSNIATKRRMMINLQRRMVNGVRQLICTSCIRTLNRKLKAAK